MANSASVDYPPPGDRYWILIQIEPELRHRTLRCPRPSSDHFYSWNDHHKKYGYRMFKISARPSVNCCATSFIFQIQVSSGVIFIYSRAAAPTSQGPAPFCQ